jgi:uncharacterized protein YbjT (DUF2867 family)
MNKKRILILGGSGFIGSALAHKLVAGGHRVTVTTRQLAHVRHLLLLPTCDVVAANVRDASTLDALVANHDVVINLIGILHGDFEAIHVAFPKLVAESCAKHRIAHLVHMSAINADRNGPSQYLRSRGRGEEAVREVAARADLPLTIFRPSVVFGENDRFLNLFACLVKLFPVLPLGSPMAQFQVVWVEDVARAIAIAVDEPATHGQTYPLVGPDVFTLRELIDFVIEATKATCLIINLGALLSRIQAQIIGLLPGKLITPDNVASMSIPNVSKEPFPAIFGKAAAMKPVVSKYMRDNSGRTRYQQLRNSAGR